MIILTLILILWLGVAAALFIPDVMRPAWQKKQDKLQCSWYEVLIYSLLWPLWLPALYIGAWILKRYKPKSKI